MATKVLAASERCDATPYESNGPRPVVALAGLGVVFLGVELVALTGWFWSGDAQRTPTGPTPVPTWMKWVIHGWEIAGVFALGVFLYYFLVRPWRREGRITTDGLFCLVFLTIFWQDSILNYFQTWYTYNAEFWNLGSWNPHIIGWLSPNGERLAEAPLWNVPLYVYGFFGMMVVGCWVMRQAKARWPRLGTFGVVMVCFGFISVGDLLAEFLWMRLGLYTYPGSISWLTIFHGHYYQFPIYEVLMVGLWGTALTSIRYFTNDKGENLAERGLSRLRVRGRRKAVVHFLALAGAINATFLVYNVPAAISGLYASPWPDDITQRSYFTNGICGPGTTYACSGPATPIPRPNSRHLTPNGEIP